MVYEETEKKMDNVNSRYKSPLRKIIVVFLARHPSLTSQPLLPPPTPPNPPKTQGHTQQRPSTVPLTRGDRQGLVAMLFCDLGAASGSLVFGDG